MNKPKLLFHGPVFSRSGYGDHSRDLLKSLFNINKFDIKIVPTNWGTTPNISINDSDEFYVKILSNVIYQLDFQPDVYVQVTVANEFRKVGRFNIGITAGVETTIVPKDFIDGCNEMDLVIVPSNFTKDVLINTIFTEVDRNTNKTIREIRVNTPVEVLFEGIDDTIFKKINSNFLDKIETSTNLLYVGHWLDGDLGHDRKDTGMLIKTFCTTFKTVPKQKQPGLILKTSSAGFSIEERENIHDKIKQITTEFGDKCPPIYLVWGDLTPEEMNELYNDDKVIGMVTFTKGEGYGRPLAEFAVTGKPILVPEWSGYLDFLSREYTEYISGELKQVHASASNRFLLPESSWFYVNYTDAANRMYNLVNTPKTFVEKSKGLATNIKKFTLTKMTDEFRNILDKYVKVPTHIKLNLPQINKI